MPMPFQLRWCLLTLFLLCLATVPPPADSASPPVKANKPSDKSVTENYTFPIDVTGTAFDSEGNPLVGATVYLVSHRVDWKQIAKTKTNAKGQYSFKKAELPILRGKSDTSRDHGIFLVYAEAAGHGFAWRPEKWFYPKHSDRRYNVDPDDDLPKRFEAGDNIELDLEFSKSGSANGRVLDNHGRPIANTKIEIWNCSFVPRNGYTTERTTDRSRRRFAVMDNNGFELLNSDVPDHIRRRQTNEAGEFKFADLPAGCRFRVRVRPPGFPQRMIYFTTEPGLETNYGKHHLHPNTDEIVLKFDIPSEVPIRVVYGDTGQLADKVYVSAMSLTSRDSVSTSTDSNGQAKLSIPPGKYKIHTLPAYQTPYLESDGTIQVSADSKPIEVLIKLRPAAEVEIRVVEVETGDPLENVDLWRMGENGRESHYTTCWEKEKRLVHRDRLRTDADGRILAYFEPGEVHCGVGDQSVPPFHEDLQPAGRTMDLKAGKNPTVTFKFRNTRN